MSLRLIPPADSKTVPQGIIGTRLFLLSKHKDPDFAALAGGGEGWTKIMEGSKEEENNIRREFEWLRSRSFMREYLLVAVRDKLDDEIPF